MTRLIAISILFFLGTAMLLSQETVTSNDLLKRAEENHKTVRADPEKAFQEAEKILQEAQRLNAREAELRAIVTQCVYYGTQNDFEKMMVTANLLFPKAESYHKPVYKAIAKYYLFETYLYNCLLDDALLELEEGMKIISRLNPGDLLVTRTKLYLLVAYMNYYAVQRDSENRLKYIKLFRIELENLPDEEKKQRARYVSYCHYALFYNDTNNLDSAKYYAKLSMSNDRGYDRDDVKFSNLSVLGQVALKEKNYQEAIYYFKEAEKITGYKNHVNIQTMYDHIIELYHELEDNNNIRIYEAKRDSLKLNVLENQYKTLHSILPNGKKAESKNYIYIFTALFSSVVILLFFVMRKNRILSRQEKISREYLKENPGSQNGEDYSGLMEMLKKNDPAFMSYFDEVFPGFTPKLLKINPKIIPSEIEFCALLKLKIPTHDIARYKYITLKSVQNRKYSIRKKLNIPKGVDIYNWFNLF